MIRYRALLVSLVLAQPGQAALKAQYKWGYLGPEGQGHGTMSVLVAEPSEQVVIELQGTRGYSWTPVDLRSTGLGATVSWPT